jgi:hypothetical protein
MWEFTNVKIRVEKNDSGNYQLCFPWGGEYKKLIPKSSFGLTLQPKTQKQGEQHCLSNEDKKRQAVDIMQHSKTIKWNELQDIVNNNSQFNESDICIGFLQGHKGIREDCYWIDIYPRGCTDSTEIYIHILCKRCEGTSDLTKKKD